MNIKDSHIILTGGSLGIGKETAKLLVEQGAKVIITGRDPERLRKAAEETGAIPVTFDIADFSSIEAKFNECLEALDGKLDALINNAGTGGSFPTIEDISIEDFQTVYNTNVFGLAILTQQAVKVFKEKSSGNIINIGSTAAQKGFARGSVYSSSKFALRSMTQCWQAELRKHNIRVALVNPSEVTTAFANEERLEREDVPNKLSSTEIAHTIVSTLTMDDRGFIPEVTVWATNPF